MSVNLIDTSVSYSIVRPPIHILSNNITWCDVTCHEVMKCNVT